MATHPFEKRGLGLAPFTLAGMAEQRLEHTGQPAGTCDYCGTGIAYCFLIRSADGKKFVVGSDCVIKTYRDFDIKDRLLSDVEREVKQLRQDQAREKRVVKRQAECAALQVRLEAAIAILDAQPALFTDQPHPSIPGRTRRDYLTWVMAHAGVAGRSAAVGEVERGGGK